MDDNLKNKHCKPCEAGVAPLALAKAQDLLNDLNHWQLINNGKAIQKKYEFKNFYKTMSFVNAIAWIANQEGHHPDLAIGYNYCHVTFTTHAIAGLSDNDFICASRIDGLEA